jgi:hypothetical protein
MNEMLPQMRNVLKKYHFMAQRNVVEQHQMLMELPHIPDVWYHRNAKTPAE